MTDAFLLVSYGAPEQRDEVLPFLNKLFAGKNVPPERVAAAAAKYEELARQTGRYSPLNDECRKLIDGIRQESSFLNAPVYWGNLFWHPMLDDTVAEMARNGVKRAVCFATSAFDSFAGNQRYADALEAARQKAGPAAPILEKLPLPYRHPLFIEAQSDRLLEAMAWVMLEYESTYVLFTAHSVPKSDAESSQYVAQLTESCRLIVEKCGPLDWELVWQSAPPRRTDWLGPDIKDRIREIVREGRYRSVVVSPIGFFCENMETINDLDLDVGKLCAESGLGFARAQTVGVSPKICHMIREMAFSR